MLDCNSVGTCTCHCFYYLYCLPDKLWLTSNHTLPPNYHSEEYQLPDQGFSEGMSPLHIAVMDENEYEVKDLFKQGTDVNTK